MKSANAICLTIIMSCTLNAIAQDKKDLDLANTDVKQAFEKFDSAIEFAKIRFSEAVGAATEKYNTEVEMLKANHITNLESIQKITTQSNDLDEAIKIRDMIKSLRESKIDLPDFRKQAVLADERTRELQEQVAKLAVAKTEKQNSRISPSLVGTWRWFDGRDCVFGVNGQAVHAKQLNGDWRLNVGSKDSFSVTWKNGSTDTLKLLEDGKLLEGFSTDKTRVWAVKLK